MSEKKAGAIIKANKTGIFAFIVILVGIAVRVAVFPADLTRTRLMRRTKRIHC